VQLVAHRARRRLTWLDTLQRERGLGAIDEPDAEQRFYAEHEPLPSINQRIAELQQIVANEQAGPVHDIASLFGLTPAELDLFITCIAPALEPTIAELYGRLHGHRHATEPLAARLFGWGRRPMWSPAGGLATWALIQ